MTPRPFVQIKWLDAEDYREAGWASEEEAEQFTQKACEVESVGWLVSKTKAHVTIAADLTHPPVTWGRLIKIPRKMIISMTEVELVVKAPKVKGP